MSQEKCIAEIDKGYISLCSPMYNRRYVCLSKAEAMLLYASLGEAINRLPTEQTKYPSKELTIEPKEWGIGQDPRYGWYVVLKPGSYYLHPNGMAYDWLANRPTSHESWTGWFPSQEEAETTLKAYLEQKEATSALMSRATIESTVKEKKPDFCTGCHKPSGKCVCKGW